MKHLIAVAALAGALAQPAAAVTFPSLTTIYVGSGILDDGSPDGQGVASSIHCSNVSGVTVQVRVLVLDNGGGIQGDLTRGALHGGTLTFSTHNVAVFLDADDLLATGAVTQGVVNVEATNSAVFCTAVVVDASNTIPTFMSPLHLVRVNAHPGTVE